MLDFRCPIATTFDPRAKNLSLRGLSVDLCPKNESRTHVELQMTQSSCCLQAAAAASSPYSLNILQGSVTMDNLGSL